jgi:tryptophan halogenase
VVIAGGGTAGWLAAAALSRQLGSLIAVTLIESDEIGTVGVGEATIPTIRRFHEIAGVDERAFMAATGATYKLGIAFEGWARPGDRYVHSFGTLGRGTWLGDFHHFWLEARDRGFGGDIGEYCAEHQAALAGRYGKDGSPEPGPELSYAFHLDATAYARHLRALSEAAGATRIEGRIADIRRDPDTGDIATLTLADGRVIDGDLFLDCTGFRALLMADTLGVGYEDWSRWLPTDRALAVQTPAMAAPPPLTRARAHHAGWGWRIPLRHRVGNGIVYASAHLSDDAAHDLLLAGIDGEPLSTPRVIRYRTGRREQAWAANCIALGLSSGFVEPLESTSLHLVMTGVTRLMQCFPFDGIAGPVRTRFNEQARAELEGVRDFVILHYHLNRRDEPFWADRRDTPVPDTLAARIALFAETGHAHQDADELFRVDSWVQVMLGQGVYPRAHHRMAGIMGDARLRQVLETMRRDVARRVASLPAHDAFLATHLS